MRRKSGCCAFPPQARSEEMNEPDLRCYHHPEREATSQCDRCGDYLCAECVSEYRDQYLCKSCLTELEPRMRKSSRNALAIMIGSAVLGFILGAAWWYWIQFLLETLPDLGPGSMYRGLRRMHPFRDSLFLGLCPVLLASGVVLRAYLSTCRRRREEQQGQGAAVIRHRTRP